MNNRIKITPEGAKDVSPRLAMVLISGIVIITIIAIEVQG